MEAQSLQARFVRLRENKLFETFVIAVIIFSALLIGAKTYDVAPSTRRLIGFLDWGITLFFLVEILVRFAAEGSVRRFFSKGWNVFDFIIVTASLLPMQESDVALLGRLIRVFRVLRLISLIPELRVLIAAFLMALPRMGYVSLLMFIIFYIYAAAGSLFFESINPDLWSNISIAMLTLFRVATFEDWTDVMYETMDTYPLSWIYYISFIFIVAFVFLNMMIGIVLETLQREHEKFSVDTGEGAASEVHRIDERTQEMADRLLRLEEKLDQLVETKAGQKE